MRYYGIQNEVKSYLNRLQSEDGIEVSPSTIKTINDRVESLKRSGVWSQYGLGFNDLDADSYFQRASLRDPLGRSEVCWFVRGMKSLNLWQNMVSWPLRSYQNAGTGSTVFSLGGLGTFNGTMVNSPTWGVNGVAISAFNRSVSTTFNFTTIRPSIFSVFSPDSTASNDARFMSNDQANTINGIGFDGAAANAIRLLGASFTSSVGVRVANKYTMFGMGHGSSNTFWFQDGIRTTQTDVTHIPSNQTLRPIGAPQANTALGIYSFSVAFDGVVTISNTLSFFYNLYKSTLGSNLGLP